MRFNFEVAPGDKRLVDVRVFARLAHVSVWMGVPTQAYEVKYSLQFEGWSDTMVDAAKCDDAARVAIAHVTNSDQIPTEPLAFGCDSDTERWPGRLEVVGGV